LLPPNARFGRAVETSASHHRRKRLRGRYCGL